MKKRIIWIGTLILVLIATIGGFFWWQHTKQAARQKTYEFVSTPTIFVHGYHGSFRSERDMMQDIADMGIGRHELTVIVSPQGKLTFQGHLDKHAKNPLIGVVFVNNTAGELSFSLWLQKVMAVLRQKYGVKQYYAVGHSMGAVAWVLYTLRDKDMHKYPKMQKLVTIAGPFDGIIGFGDKVNRNYFINAKREPKYQTTLFQWMKQNSSNFPSTVPVLNIYGDLENGSNSDAVVSIVSARSLSYLIQPYAKSYEELKVTGPNAEHSLLHQHNQTVSHALENFLWGKPIPKAPNLQK